MSDFICGLYSAAGGDGAGCRKFLWGEKLETPVGAACSSSPTGSIEKDMAGDAANETLDAQGLTDTRDVSHTNPLDKDNDGYTDIAYKGQYCVEYKPGMEVSKKLCDCNDNIASINPGAKEICDDIDNNCNGIVDEECVFPEDIKGDTEIIDESICTLKWKKLVDPHSESILADLDGDGTQEIIMKRGHIGYNCQYGCETIDPAKIYVFDQNGEIKPGWPVGIAEIIDPGFDYSAGTQNAFAVGDLDGNGTKEIIYSDGDSLHSWVIALNHDGTVVEGWPVYVDDLFSSTQTTISNFKIALGNITNEGENQGKLEVVGVTRENVYVWSSQGQLLSGWPQSHQAHSCTIALGDLDQDGDLEIVNTGYGDVLAWNHDGAQMPGFPLAIEAEGCSDAVLADLDSDGILEIISREAKYNYQTMKYNYWFNIINSDGTIKNKFETPQNKWTIRRGSVGDINGSGNLAIMHRFYLEHPGCDNCYDIDLYAYKYDGTVFPGWPVNVLPSNAHEEKYGISLGGEVIADIDGDGKKEFVVAADTTDAFLRIYGGDGNLKGIIKGDIGNPITFNVSVGDLDGNGKMDVVLTGYQGWIGGRIYRLECAGEYDPANIDWAMRGHDAQNTYNHETPIDSGGR